MVSPVKIEIENHYDFDINNYPVTVGVPFPEGELGRVDALKLQCNDIDALTYFSSLSCWPDGSVKWALLDFKASIKSDSKSRYSLVTSNQDACSDEHHENKQYLSIKESDATYMIDTGEATFSVSKNQLFLFEKVGVPKKDKGAAIQSGIYYFDEGNEQATSVIESAVILDSSNKLRQVIKFAGYFESTDSVRLADYELKMTFYSGSSTIKNELTLLNTRAAKHPGGVWDLGDPGSLYFSRLLVGMKLTDKSAMADSSIRISPDSDWRYGHGGNVTLHQESSGGENWDSTNHVDASGQVPLVYRGYRLLQKGAIIEDGDRASPVVHQASSGIGVTAYMEKFWQNFPKSVELDQRGIQLGIFPEVSYGNHELQAGERKRHTFYLNFGDDRESLDMFVNDVIPKVDLQHYYRSGVIPWLPEFSEESTMQKLIDRGVSGKNNFFEKRETIDEYGWRNYGDIFADHELHEYSGNDELISHYNNQYDPIYGFFRQYLITGDSRWHELFTDLADHVIDIDIYHTESDRGELNGGLFWHTFHYLNAFTCTHRTFSSHQADDFIYGEVGGGPGAEHCYTTGLAYCYFITGDEVYREAAIDLIEWISRVFNGSGTVAERCLRFINRDIPAIRKLVSGEKVQRYAYPFTRGTGNYIASLIDGYSLSADTEYIRRIENVISSSCHPSDDISFRNLKDKEMTWSYLVYLQSVCKYIQLKVSLGEIDNPCVFARECVLHYARWMLANEEPFLHNPEVLEYPNKTWVAQDLRKASILYMASLYSLEDSEKFLKAARYYTGYVEDTLKDEETRYYARILILLMQNDIRESSLNYEAYELLSKAPASYDSGSAPLHSVTGIFFSFVADFFRGIFKISLQREIRWLRFRLEK